MQAGGLIDTGAILALLDPNDPWHTPCTSAFRQLRLPLATTAAVFTEVFHLTAGYEQRVAAVWRALRAGAITVLPISDQDLASLEALMIKYADRPMDFADATLVHLAKRESISTIFTIDHNDFETYRIDGKRKFRIFPLR